MSSSLSSTWNILCKSGYRYKGLASRVVDLVGDFAGKETFIIEGDSLLLQGFSNKKLDFRAGFQVLHATYIIEELLWKLQQRKCVFEIVFFAENARLCIPAGVEGEFHDRYLLAREAIIRHLVSVSLQPKTCLVVQRFDNFRSRSFEAHLNRSGAYLLMCHDGSFAEKNENALSGDHDSVLTDSGSESKSDSDNNDQDAGEDNPDICAHERRSRVELRMLIHWLFVHGYSVALINSLEFRDTKVL